MLIETGVIKPKDPITTAVFVTQAGSVAVQAKVRSGSVESATLCNVPSFLYKSMKIAVPEIGETSADIAFGGLFHAIVGASACAA